MVLPMKFVNNHMFVSNLFLNDILKTIYEKEKNIGKGMQTALSCDFYYILS